MDGDEEPDHRLKAKHRIVACDLCQTTVRFDKLRTHRNSRFCKLRCDICGKKMAPGFLQQHKESHLLDLNTEMSQSSSNSQSFQDITEGVSEELKDIYSAFRTNILNSEKLGRIMNIYNYTIGVFSSSEISYHFKKIFRMQKSAFKINISIGYVLYNNKTTDYAYYASSQNNQLLFEKPKLIRNSIDKQNFLESLSHMDLPKVVARPNSEWVFVTATNITFFVYKLNGIAIGSTFDLPSYLVNNKGLISLVRNMHTGTPYNDSKCFFRCLAIHLGADVKALEKKTNQLLKEYCVKASIADFPGVSLDQLEDISRIFRLGINVYEQTENRDTLLIFRTTLEENTMNINLHEEHFSYIQDLNKYSSSFRCHKCDKILSHSGHFNRHIKSCDFGIKKKYVGGVFQIKPTIFEELQDQGIEISDELRIFPYRAVFDIECMAQQTDACNMNTDKLEYTFEHKLLSISICANVPEYQKPRCLILEKDDEYHRKKMVKDMVDYLIEISEASAYLLREKYQEYMDQINVSPLKDKFETYINQLPVLTFNGSRYDLKVLRKYLIPVLVDLDSMKFVIKRGTSYMCIVTEELKFMDILFYLAPGFSYNTFLKAYGAVDSKSFFPYEWMDSLEKLDNADFPPYNAFFSSLCNANTIEVAYYEELVSKDKEIEPETALKEAKKLAQHEYQRLKSEFEEHDMQFRDYLIKYNNLDTQPFIQALDVLTRYYSDRGIDLFKEAVSVPGVAERLAFKSLKPTETFHLFNNKHSDLWDLFSSNIVGGPAIIFNRYMETGVTNIRHNPDGQVCKNIIGLDANALYLHSMAQEMPCGMFLRRRACANFMKEYPTAISQEASEWLAYVEASQNIELVFNRKSKEHRVGSRQLPVDGFCRANNTVFQYHGCYWHGCETCYLEDREVGEPSFNKRRENTRLNEEYVTDEGYLLVSMWACDWKRLRKTVTLSKKYLYPTEHLYRMSEKRIIENIINDNIYGAVEVDIEVPNELREFFSEFPPLFKNVLVKEDDIGNFMQEYLRKRNEKFNPTKYLISSMFATKILIITPLLKWYLKHGLIVTKIYQLVEFVPKKCFEDFANNISDDRRAGDKDQSKKVIAETSKLTGNTVYGHSIMRKDLHSTVKFCHLDRATKYVNDPYFTGATEFSDEYFEISLQKKHIRYDLPIQLGFFVYSFAKLRMLSFFYDMMDHFVSRDNYCLLETDTDSFYFALSGIGIDELIKPKLKHEWRIEKRKWFPRTDSDTNIAYDLRTPGLFKIEWAGHGNAGFIGLNAKTYICYDKSKPRRNKISAKGVIGKLNHLTQDHFLAVLTDRSSHSIENKGFKMLGDRMLSYEIHKKGLSYFYGKRKVLSDGISTTYLDV